MSCQACSLPWSERGRRSTRGGPSMAMGGANNRLHRLGQRGGEYKRNSEGPAAIRTSRDSLQSRKEKKILPCWGKESGGGRG